MQFQECELQMAFSLEGSGKAGVKIWIIEIGGGVKKTDSNTISVKFGPIAGKRADTYAALGKGKGPPLGKRSKG
jgi:hypothetical protein